MIPARIAILILSIACWDAWRLLAGRIDDTGTGLLVGIMVAVLGRRVVAMRDERVPAPPLAAALSGYALACVTGPALLQIGAASGALALVAARGAGWPRLPVAGLVALLLPVLPTFDFLLAYPLRRVSAAIAVGLLRSNGVPVGLDGIALEWRGQALLFDGPCSGVRMLWAALVLASIVAIAARQAPVIYLRGLAAATGIAVAGNALRAASLFYLENGFVTGLGGPIAHEMVGVLAFGLVAVALLAIPCRQKMAP